MKTDKYKNKDKSNFIPDSHKKKKQKSKAKKSRSKKKYPLHNVKMVDIYDFEELLDIIE